MADTAAELPQPGAQEQNALHVSPEELHAEIIAAAENFVRQRFEGNDPSHDWHHVHRVRLLALSVSRCPSITKELDPIVLEIGALFHDLTDSKYALPTSTCGSGPGSTSNAAAPQIRADPSSIPGARTVLEPFFAQFPTISTEQQQSIIRIVDNVSWSKDEARREARAKREAAGEDLTNEKDEVRAWQEGCQEFWCVSDADRLDAIGSIGIMRCAAFSAARSRPLYIPPANPEGDSAPPAEQAEGYNGSAVAHFHEKLLKIQGDRLWTDAAREEASRRQQIMRSFLTELDIEWLVADRGAQLSLLR